MRRLCLLLVVSLLFADGVLAQTATPTLDPVGMDISLGTNGTNFARNWAWRNIGTWTESAGYLSTTSAVAYLELEFVGTHFRVTVYGSATYDDVKCLIYDPSDLFGSPLVEDILPSSSASGWITYTCPLDPDTLDNGKYFAVLLKATINTEIIYISRLMFPPSAYTMTEITVYPTPTEITMIPPTPDGASVYATIPANGIDQIVAFRYQVDAGQVMIVILLAAMLVVLIVLLVVMLRKRAPEP